MSALSQRHAFVRDSRSGDVAAQPFQLGAIIRSRPHARMQGEASCFGQVFFTVRFNSGYRSWRERLLTGVPTTPSRPEAERVGTRFDVSERSNGNGGHLFGTTLPEAEKEALVEHLKTL